MALNFFVKGSLLFGFYFCAASGAFFGYFNFGSKPERGVAETYFAPLVTEDHLKEERDFEAKLLDIRKTMHDKFEALNWTREMEESPPPENDTNIIEINESMWDQISSANDLSDLGRLLGVDFGEGERGEEDSIAYEENGREIALISSSGDHLKMAKSSVSHSEYWPNPERAGCQPERKVVELELQKMKDVIYFPTCVRVNRCGGCCHSEKQLCQPIEIKDITIKVVKISQVEAASYSNRVRRERSSRGRGRGRRSARAAVIRFNETIHEHTLCQCLCKLKESECNPTVQKYNHRLCTCECLNKDDENKCLDESDKVWNNKTCKCECRKRSVCSTGYEFDDEICLCQPKKARLFETGLRRHHRYED